MAWTCSVAVTLAGLGGTAFGQEVPKDYQEVLTVLGKKGDYKERVLKVNIPRNDLKISVAGVPTPTAFGFGGWVAMTKGDHNMDVMMGDLVLLEDEVNPVMSALLEHGLQVTALTATGRAAGKSEVTEGQLNEEELEKTIGHKGERTGSVVKFTVGRDGLKLREMGAPINSRMGLNTWAAFVGSDEKAAAAGDVAMLENEVNPVLKALRSHGLDVVAIHQHMLGTQPEIIFLHYWGTGPAGQLAEGFKTALNELGQGQHGTHQMSDAGTAGQ